MAALQQWIANATGRKRLFVKVPDAVGAALASGLGWLPGAPITRDQWLMLQHDTVVTDDSDGVAQPGITPTALADVVDGSPDERSVGEEWVGTGRWKWSPYQ